jgi:SWI/SNF-related matrix-associated actin-dependent regulator of chromatin subfamily A3
MSETFETVFYEGTNRENLVYHIHTRKWNIVFVSYDTMARDYGNHMKAKSDDDGLPPPTTLFALSYHRVILDEVHTIRNPETKTFQAAVSVKATHKLALTGSPFVNRVSFPLALSTTFHH